MSLRAPEKIRKLQTTLHAKAKESSSYRFYSLYDKLYREDILEYAYRCCKANGGAPGVDGEDFAEIEAYGREKWLGELAKELHAKTYQPNAIRRVYIPKPDGGERPLGIPTVRDRVAQTAAVVLLSPIFEADLPEEQYAYREGRNAHEAIKKVHGLVNSGHTEIVDADLSGYFDSIPHVELMKSVARRISDRWMLKVIKAWLTMAVEETDEHGRPRRSNPARRTKRGIPQGSPISPLLSNLYMRRFILSWKQLGYEAVLQAYIVNYADDFVICCRETAAEAMQKMRSIMERLKLTVNERKTRLRRLPNEQVEFLGYSIGRCFNRKTGKTYLGTYPAKERVKRVCRKISVMTCARTEQWPVEERVAALNRVLQGWANYFCLGPVSPAYRAIDKHTQARLRQWLRRKHKLGSTGIARFPAKYLYDTLGLVKLELRTRNFPWAKA